MTYQASANVMDIFTFKAFDILQDDNVMRINTDGVLLGAWAMPENPKNILDIGCGTGVISLMMAQRFKNATIQAIDIEARAAKLSALNFNRSSWSNRLTALQEDLETFTERFSEGYFDFIITNPPFFNNSTPAFELIATRAKHTKTLSHSAIINCAKILLKNGGELAMILPVHEAIAVMVYAEQTGFRCSSRMIVYPDETKQAIRIAFKLIISKINKEVSFEQLFIRSGIPKNFSPKYKNLTKDFYLNF